MEINCLECAADDVMRDGWELLHDDCNERPRARPRPSSPHIQHQSLAMRPTLGRDQGKLLGFDIIRELLECLVQDPINVIAHFEVCRLFHSDMPFS